MKSTVIGCPSQHPAYHRKSDGIKRKPLMTLKELAVSQEMSVYKLCLFVRLYREGFPEATIHVAKGNLNYYNKEKLLKWFKYALDKYESRDFK